MPITSIYTWHKELHQEQEGQLIIKTELALFTAVAQKIQQLHSYEVSEIIALPLVAGSPAYLQWIFEQVNQ